jgi:crotonobetainyl-CoA:carnitine CoA-transferase CaiB-like acyl-CoA transferase
MREVMEVAEQHEVAVGPILDVGDIAAHEQYLGRESIVRVPDGISGKPVAVQNVVPIFSESPSGHRWLGRSLGADDDAILGGEIGVDDADLERFRAAGVIASDPR